MNPPANAGDVFNRWSGETPHAFAELNSCAKMRRKKNKHEALRVPRKQHRHGSFTPDQAPWTFGLERTVTLRKNLENGTSQL